MPLYFAYGSNMSQRQMQQRCPGAQPFGRGRLSGWRFLITTRGGANIVRDPDADVHGVLWRVSPRHLKLLDRWEGTREGVYRRAWVPVIANGRAHPAVAYIGDRRWPAKARPNYILTAILPGAITFDLPADYREDLSSWLAARPIGPVSTIYRGRRSPRIPVRRPRRLVRGS
ncbi:MAG: gamma-glutamylcyclotransferase family protein [Pseudomonadota bacterium]